MYVLNKLVISSISSWLNLLCTVGGLLFLFLALFAQCSDREPPAGRVAARRRAGEHLQALQKNLDLWTTSRGRPTYIGAVLVFLLLNLKIWYITEIIVRNFPLSSAAVFLPCWGLVVKFPMHCSHGAMEKVSFKLGLIAHSKKLAEAVLTQYLWGCSHVVLCFHPPDGKKINKNSLILLWFWPMRIL